MTSYFLIDPGLGEQGTLACYKRLSTAIKAAEKWKAFWREGGFPYDQLRIDEVNFTDQRIATVWRAV